MSNINCAVALREGVSGFGIFANAIRIREESDQEVYLDFCIYSAEDNLAEVVARIRIHKSFLPILAERLNVEVREIPSRESKQGSSLLYLVKPADKPEA